MKKQTDTTLKKAIQAQGHKRTKAEQASKKRDQELKRAVQTGAQNQVNATKALAKSLEKTVKGFPKPPTAEELANAIAMVMAAQSQPQKPVSEEVPAAHEEPQKPVVSEASATQVQPPVQPVVEPQPQPQVQQKMPTAAEIAEAMAARGEFKPQQKDNRALVIGMIVVAIVFAIMGCVITALIMRDNKGNKGDNEVTINTRFEEERAALIELVNKKTEESTKNLVNVVSQSMSDRLKGVTESQTAIVNEFRLALMADREKADSQMSAITAQLGNLAGVVGRVNGKVDEQAEIAKNNAKQNNQYFDERIAAVMGVVNRLENQTARTETSKQPEPVVAAPVSETRNEQSSTSTVGASAGSSKESEEVVLEDKSSWNGAVKLGWRSNGLRENGTTSSDGSVMTADARVSWKNLYVNVGMMKGDNLNDEQNVAVGYEWKNFDFSTGFEKRPNGNRLFVGAAMNYPAWEIGRNKFFIVANAKWLMYTDDLVSSNREVTKSGYEVGAGIKHEISLAKWWDLTSQLGLMHQSGYDQVWRVSPWGKGWPYNIDASTVGYVKVGSKFGITRNIDFNVDLLGTSTLGKTKFVKNGFESSFGVSLDINVFDMFRRR